MVWEAVSAVMAVIAGGASYVAYSVKREADRVLAPRVECNSYPDDDRTAVIHMYRVGGENGQHWTVESVRVAHGSAKVALMVETRDDEYGNTLSGPGTWDTYLDLTDCDGDLGFATAPAEQPVHLIFTLAAKSDLNIKRDARTRVRAFASP